MSTNVRRDSGISAVSPIEPPESTLQPYHPGVPHDYNQYVEVNPRDWRRESEGLQVRSISSREGPTPSRSAAVFVNDDPEKGSVRQGHVELAEPRIMNIRRNWFWFILLSFLTIGGIAAGLGAGLSRKRRGTAVSSSSIEILNISNIAAVNWTTAGFSDTHAVFYQDIYGSLIAHAEQNGSVWTTVNISSIFDDHRVPLMIIPGSPIAAVAKSDLDNFEDDELNQLSVYYLAPGNVVTEITTQDPSLEKWLQGPLGSFREVEFTTAPGSHLAAVWQRCTNPAVCDKGMIHLGFQDTDQNFMIANSSADWNATIASPRFALNSSMALISMSFDNDTNAAKPFSNATDYVWGFYETNSIVGSAWQDYTANGRWLNDGRNVLSDIITSTENRFAATSFNDRKHAFMTAAYPNGTIVGKHWSPDLDDWEPQHPVDLVDGSPDTNFSAIAMTPDARLYGVSNGHVLEYNMNESKPYTFHFVGQVF